MDECDGCTGCLFSILKLVILILLIGLICACISRVKGASNEFDILWTDKQIALHEAADILREAGFTDDDSVIQSLSDQWWQERIDLQMTAKTIYKEAGGCSWDHMVYVGAVIWNRVRSGYFPNTVYDVLIQPNQYSVSYTHDFIDIPEKCYKAAVVAMNGDHDAPEDLYWQAEFSQGKEIWKVFEIDTGYYRSTTYFCRGVYYE